MSISMRTTKMQCKMLSNMGLLADTANKTVEFSLLSSNGPVGEPFSVAPGDGDKMLHLLRNSKKCQYSGSDFVCDGSTAASNFRYNPGQLYLVVNGVNQPLCVADQKVVQDKSDGQCTPIYLTKTSEGQRLFPALAYKTVIGFL